MLQKKDKTREFLHLTELKTSHKPQHLFWMCHNTLVGKKFDFFPIFPALERNPPLECGSKAGEGQEIPNFIPQRMENDSVPSFQGFCHRGKFRRNSEFKGSKNQKNQKNLIQLQRETSYEQQEPNKFAKTPWGERKSEGILKQE